MKFFPTVDNITEYKYDVTFEHAFRLMFPDIMKISKDPPVQFQSDIREIGFGNYEVKLHDKEESSEEVPIYYFDNEDSNYAVFLSRDILAISSVENNQDINDFENIIMDILNIFSKHYNFIKFIGAGIIQRNIINRKIIPDLDEDLEKIISKDIFPEIMEDKACEIDRLEKTSMMKSDDIMIRLLHIFGKVSGEFGGEGFHNEKSYIIDIKAFREVDIDEIKRIPEQFKEISKICQSIFHYSIDDSFLTRIVR